jgi:hypothetical protein
MFTMRGKGDWGRGVPYGVAIAAGAVMVTWAGLMGVLDPFPYSGRPPVTAHALSGLLANHGPERR